MEFLNMKKYILWNENLTGWDFQKIRQCKREIISALEHSNKIYTIKSRGGKDWGKRENRSSSHLWAYIKLSKKNKIK